jgi:hypothetical protein
MPDRPAYFSNEQLAHLDRLIDVKQIGIEEDWADDVAEVSADVFAATVEAAAGNAAVGNVEGAAATGVAAGVAAGIAFVAATIGSDSGYRELLQSQDARRALVQAVDAIPLQALIDIRRMGIEGDA